MPYTGCDAVFACSSHPPSSGADRRMPIFAMMRVLEAAAIRDCRFFFVRSDAVYALNGTSPSSSHGFRLGSFRSFRRLPLAVRYEFLCRLFWNASCALPFRSRMHRTLLFLALVRHQRIPFPLSSSLLSLFVPPNIPPDSPSGKNGPFSRFMSRSRRDVEIDSSTHSPRLSSYPRLRSFILHLRHISTWPRVLFSLFLIFLRILYGSYRRHHCRHIQRMCGHSTCPNSIRPPSPKSPPSR